MPFGLSRPDTILKCIHVAKPPIQAITAHKVVPEEESAPCFVRPRDLSVSSTESHGRMRLTSYEIVGCQRVV